MFGNRLNAQQTAALDKGHVRGFATDVGSHTSHTAIVARANRDELGFGRVTDFAAVIGGGVIGCEYASVFATLGVQVTLVERGDRILPFVDQEIAARLRSKLEGLGLRFVLNERVLKTEKTENDVHLTLQVGEQLICDCALFAD